jgi:hypothetical protein
LKRSGFLLALGLVIFWLPLHAEEIQLKDGNKISGKVISLTDESFQIKTAYGNIQVPRSDIVSISFPENQTSSKNEAATESEAAVVDESLNGTTYINRTAKFQVAVPSGWISSETLRKQSKDIIAALESPDQTLFFFVTPEIFNGSLSTYRVLAETKYQMSFKDFEKLSESEVPLDGKTAIRLIWRGKNTKTNDTPLKSVVYIIPYDGRMVRLSFLTLEPLFETGLPIFERIAASYSSIKP